MKATVHSSMQVRKSPDCAKEVVPAIVDQGVELNAAHDQTFGSFSSLHMRLRQ